MSFLPFFGSSMQFFAQHALWRGYMAFPFLGLGFILDIVHVRACSQQPYPVKPVSLCERTDIKSLDYRVKVFISSNKKYSVGCWYLNNMMEAFTVTQFHSERAEGCFPFFCCNEAKWRGGWRLCCAMPPQCTTVTTQSSRWNERSASPRLKLYRWEEEMTMDLFLLGHMGVAYDRTETNRKGLEEVNC